MRIGLVGCVKSKLDHAASARDLYTSDLFIGRRRYVQQSCDRWYVLSALHGLVQPAEVINPYDLALKSFDASKRRAWSQRVVQQLGETLGSISGITFEAHAGSSYLDFGLIDGLTARGATVEVHPRTAARAPVTVLRKGF